MNKRVQWRFDPLAAAAVGVLVIVAAAVHWAAGSAPRGVSNTLRWTVASEAPIIVGYDVYRRQLGVDGPFEKITREPIDRAEDARQGYVFQDRTILDDTAYEYYLAAVTREGRRHRLPGTVGAEPKRAAVTSTPIGVAMLGALLLLALLHRALGRWQPIGDEKEYLDRAAWEDPERPRWYVRVPLFIYLVRWVTRQGRHVGGARALMLMAIVGSVATVTATALAVGAAPFYVALGLLLALEFFIYGLRLWPEPLLALFHATAIAILVFGGMGPMTLASLGLVAMLATAIRLEQLVLAPALALALWLSGAPLGPSGAMLVIAPTLAFLVVGTLRNGRRYGIWWPDTTWQFNAALALQEAAASDGPVTHIESAIATTVRRYNKGERLTAPRLTAGLTLRLAVDFLRRSLAFLAKDTFVRFRLFAPHGQGFPSITAQAFFDAWLRLGFPLLVGLGFVAALAADHWPIYMIPTLALYFACTVCHSRTRYRQLLIPGLVVWQADAMSRLDGGFSALAWLVLAAITAVLGMVSIREED